MLLARFGGYRPVLTWVLAGEHLVFGTSPVGYHVVGLALHLLCGALFWALLGRFFVGPFARAGVVTLWLCSPYCIEPVQSIAPCIYPMIFACWLGIALLWPGPNEQWRRRRAGLAITLGALSAGLLESWVVLPCFVMVFDLAIARAQPRAALRRSTWATLPVVAYLVAYSAKPAVDVSTYYTAGIAGISKIPHIWAVFCGLTTLRPHEIRFGIQEALALLIMAGLAWIGVQRRSHLSLVGFAFFLLPLLPLIPVGFLTTRYTAAPLAGFLAVVAVACSDLLNDLRPRGRVLGRCAVGALGVVYFTSGLASVRGETADRQKLDLVHQKLLLEAARFAPQMPRAGLVVSVRQERENPLLDLSLTQQGLPKGYYARSRDPYALIDTAALWSWVLDAQGGPLYYNASARQMRGELFSVVVHEVGGFVKLEPSGSLEEAVSRWEGKRFPVTVLTTSWPGAG